MLPTTVHSFLSQFAKTPVHPVYAPASWVVLLHALSVSYHYQQQERVPFCQALVSYLTLCLGGSTLCAILLNEIPAWLLSPTALYVYLAVFLVTYPPSPVNKVIASYKHVFVPVLAFADAFSVAYTLTTGVDLAVTKKAGLPGQFVCGVLAGSGAGILNEIFGISKPNWSISSFSGRNSHAATLGSVLYIAMLTHRCAPADVARNWTGLFIAVFMLFKYCPWPSCPAIFHKLAAKETSKAEEKVVKGKLAPVRRTRKVKVESTSEGSEDEAAVEPQPVKRGRGVRRVVKKVDQE